MCERKIMREREREREIDWKRERACCLTVADVVVTDIDATVGSEVPAVRDVALHTLKEIRTHRAARLRGGEEERRRGEMVRRERKK